ncbi:MAG TPA: hypothetical protein VML58_11375 [Burkholderiaceae bacterium]|nr:hypothetical protein [Burkholderiaceae bacterium]
MKTSLTTRIVSLLASALVTYGGVTVLADYALPPDHAPQSEAATRQPALLAAAKSDGRIASVQRP